MPMRQKYVLLLISTCLCCYGTLSVYCGENTSLNFSEEQYLKIPLGGLARFDKEKLYDFLLSAPYFRNAFPADFKFEATLKDFKNGNADFYMLFMKQKEALKKITDKKAILQNEKLLSLYNLLWLYEDKKQHEKLLKYLNGMDSDKQIKFVLFLINVFGDDYFSPEIYPIFEKAIQALASTNGAFGGSPVLLSIFLQTSRNIFSPEQLSALAGMAVERVVMSGKKKDDKYINYFLVLSDYAGKESMPYFREFFENECCASTLVAISGYFRRNLSTLEFDSMMRRKAYLLQESQTAINELLNPQVEKSEGISQVPAE